LVACAVPARPVPRARSHAREKVNDLLITLRVLNSQRRLLRQRLLPQYGGCCDHGEDL